MAQANTNDTVRVHYTGTFEDGTVFDTSRERGPLEFTIGSQNLIAGFEQAVVGMAPGDTKTEKIAADNAYGPFRNELVQDIERSQFPADAELTVGQRFQASAGGSNMVLTIIDLSEETVTVDGNHPLAGKDLIFELELVEIV